MNTDSVILNTLLEISEDAIIVSDESYRVLRVNPTFNKLTGLDAREVKGRILVQHDCGIREEPLLETVENPYGKGSSWTGLIHIRKKDGKVFTANGDILTVNDGQGNPIRHIAVLRPGASPEGHPNDKGSRQLDPLTKLPNRFLLDDRLEQALIASRRTKKSVALFTIGLDRFITVNDGLGFAIGDMVLKKMGERLLETVRHSDTIARLAGDIFSLVMVVTSVNDTVLLAEKILKIISDPFFVEGHEVIITASIGISIFPADGEDAASLLKRSESAMRHAKKTGGKKYQFFAGEMNTRAKHRIETENNIRHALEQNEFLLYYQPKIDTKNEAIIGAEALIRWNNPARGLIPPGEFIPIAEESGLILQVGAWVLRRACKQCKDWLDEGLKPIRISINVASHQLRSSDFSDQVIAILAETRLPANLLELEITESNMMDNSVACMKVLQAFRDMGIHISIDDFGTGYSCLSYLSRFPITTLKIDRAFVNNLQDNNNAEITRAIISLSHSLKLDVIAEGAEVADQIKFLGIHGCTVVQGFFYSKPVSAEEFEKMLRVGYIHKS